MRQKLTHWAMLLVAIAVLGWFVTPDFIRDFQKGDACNDTKARFEQAIHYAGRSHIVTTINGVPSNDPTDDYYTRGYSGPTTAAERSTMNEAMASWSSLNCKGPINPNSEFWR
jgi:hypothetical protein